MSIIPAEHPSNWPARIENYELHLTGYDEGAIRFSLCERGTPPDGPGEILRFVLDDIYPASRPAEQGEPSALLRIVAVEKARALLGLVDAAKREHGSRRVNRPAIFV